MTILRCVTAFVIALIGALVRDARKPKTLDYLPFPECTIIDGIVSGPSPADVPAPALENPMTETTTTETAAEPIVPPLTELPEVIAETTETPETPDAQPRAQRGPTAAENPHGVAKGQVWRDKDSRSLGAVFTVNRILFDRNIREWVAEGTRGAGKMSGRETHIQLDRFNTYTNVTDEVDPPAVGEG